jgi:hypothetical protein
MFESAGMALSAVDKFAGRFAGMRVGIVAGVVVAGTVADIVAGIEAGTAKIALRKLAGRCSQPEVVAVAACMKVGRKAGTVGHTVVEAVVEAVALDHKRLDTSADIAVDTAPQAVAVDRIVGRFADTVADIVGTDTADKPALPV